MAKLPNMAYGSGIGKRTQTQFGGLRHHPGCGEGEIYDMMNMSCRSFPILETRKQRRMDSTMEGISQIYADNGVFLLVDAKGYIWHEAHGMRSMYPVAKRRNTIQWARFIRFGDRVVIMPDRIVLNLRYDIVGFAQSSSVLPQTNLEMLEGAGYLVGGQEPPYVLWVCQDGRWHEVGPFSEAMEQSVTVSTATILNGTLYGLGATANTLAVSEVDLRKYFRPGDAVAISGMTKVPYNNKIPIIREVEEHLLRFSDYCFTMPTDEDGNVAREYEEQGEITLSRDVPELEVLFEHGNRLWGAAGKKIYASKVGDPLNWNVFDGISTDSWSLETQGQGDITGGISYGGYPMFFRENSATIIYGAIPSAFQAQEVKLPGVAGGAADSLGIAGGMLFYLSPNGMQVYGGEYPKSLQQVFGDGRYRMPFACSDGTTYFIRLADGNDETALYVYDSIVGLWTKEEDPGVRQMCYMDGSIYGVTAKGELIELSGGNLGREGSEVFRSFVEFGDFTEEPNRRSISRLQIRVAVDEGASLTVKLQYDSNGEWVTVWTVAAGKKRSEYLPVLPRRCDHFRLRLEAEGAWQLYSITRELRIGSEMH